MSRLQSAAGRVPQGWSFGHWPLRRKLAAALALPVLLAFFFGGLRVKTDFDAARELSNAADTVTVIRPVVEYNLAVQKLAAAGGVGGGGTIAAIRQYENAAANLRIALKTEGVPDSVKRNGQNALTLGQAVRTAKTQSGFSDIVIDKSGNTATLMSTAASDLGLSDDAASAKIVVALQDAIAAQRAMTGQQLNLGNTDDAAAAMRAIGQVGAETAALTRIQATAPIAQAGAVRQLLNENGRRNYTLAQESPDQSAIEGLGPIFESSNAGYGKLMDAQLSSLESTLRDTAAAHKYDAIVNASLIGLALLVALLLVLGLLRSLLNPIRAVRSGALDIANRRLPEAVAAMRDGGEAPAFEPIPVTTHEEMGQLARAVDDLHSQALALAGEQARLRVQVGHMFETLSRRSTSLIDQQLTLIERLESDEEDPKRLQSLFRLDHLAARMRRNSDSLLVLAGTSTRRGVSGAIAVSDAVRAAVSEVENYERIDIGDTSNDKVLGAVGSDLIHLLAEVVDNALAYSPPTTRVAIRGARTPEGGLLVEVSDRGLGMPPRDLAALNDRLANGGDITTDTARRMGLFVVGSLAKRHGIAVRLRRNGDDKQGITVSVHLPAGLLADSTVAPERQARPAAKAAPAAGPAQSTAAGPTLSAVGGTTKAGLPSRVRGASGAPTVGGPSPVPGAAKKVLPTRTPGAHGPNADTALPAPVKPVIEGTQPVADKPVINGAPANGHDEAKVNGDEPTVNGHDEPQANGHDETPGATAAAVVDAPPADQAPAVEGRSDDAPKDSSPTDGAPQAPAVEESPKLSPSGLPMRRSGATNITAYREFEDAAPTADAAAPADPTTQSQPTPDAPAPKGSRLMNWLPGRAKAQAAEAARLEAAAAAEPRQMPSNLSAWLDHRAKLVEAAKTREEGGDVADAPASSQPADDSSAPEAEVHVPQEWVAEAQVEQDAQSATEEAEAVDTAPEARSAEPAETTEPEGAESSTTDVPAEAETHQGALPTRVPGATAAVAEPDTANQSAVPTGRPGVRAHHSSFFGARRRGPVGEPTAVEAAGPEATVPEAVTVEDAPAEVADAPAEAPVEPTVELAHDERVVDEPEVVAQLEPAPEQAFEPVAEQAFEPVAEQGVETDPEPAPVSSNLNDTPIFRAMMSRWLTDEEPEGSTGWSSSAADDAWSAAARAEETRPLEESSAGLPMRRPGNRLVPGAIEQSATPPAAPTSSRRDPETIRRNLTRHQQGVSSARTEAQDGTHREEADVHH